jgi:hypothetical protein
MLTLGEGLDFVVHLAKEVKQQEQPPRNPATELWQTIWSLSQTIGAKMSITNAA